MKADPKIIMEAILKDLDINYKTEYRFCERRWRFDYCIPDLKVACELEGMVYRQGRHTRGLGYSKDCEKYNKAALLGWKVLRYTTNQVRDNPAQVYEDLRYLKEQINQDGVTHNVETDDYYVTIVFNNNSEKHAFMNAIKNPQKKSL